MSALDNISKVRALLPEDDPNFARPQKSAKERSRAPELDRFYAEEKAIKQRNIIQEIAGAKLFQIFAENSFFLSWFLFFFFFSSFFPRFFIYFFVPQLYLTFILFLDQHKEGPLSVLRACLAASERVRVVTRAMSSIRGFVEGKLIAFDKHFNVVLILCYFLKIECNFF